MMTAVLALVLLVVTLTFGVVISWLITSLRREAELSNQVIYALIGKFSDLKPAQNVPGPGETDSEKIGRESDSW